MPELSDVEGWKRYANRFVRDARVRSVHVADDGVLQDTSPQGLGQALNGRSLSGFRRRGKWLLGDTDGPVLAIHFGMTGSLRFTSGDPEDHEHDRVRFELDRGHLAYRSQRKLGKVALAPDEESVEDVTGPLGPDADEISTDDFAELLDGRRGKIKSSLMDQELIAGVGNELSDEILWRARLHPERPVRDLDAEEIAALHREMEDVLRVSKRHGRIPAEPEWLESVRGEEAPRCPRCGADIETIDSAGRTAYVCPAEQR